jgi:hypothetical protein
MSIVAIVAIAVATLIVLAVLIVLGTTISQRLESRRLRLEAQRGRAA